MTARTEEQDGTAHTLEVGFTPGEPKAIRVDGAPVDNLSTSTARPLASVFLPERLELVKGAPRRAAPTSTGSSPPCGPPGPRPGPPTRAR